MNNRPIDRSKKSNIKCEHCQFWCEWGIEGWCKNNYCMNPYSEHYHHQRKYWNRCKDFKWAESEDFPRAKDIEPTVKGFVDTMGILDHLCDEK